MTVTGGKPLHTQTGIELYILKLAADYKVSDRFLTAVVPKIKDIFALNIPQDQRDALLDLAEKSFKLQAETEAILRTCSSLEGSLKSAPLTPTLSRRRSQVNRRDVQMKKAPAKARSVG
jgi:hypothetical protein